MITVKAYGLDRLLILPILSYLSLADSFIDEIKEIDIQLSKSGLAKFTGLFFIGS